jgi:FAD/FMN-containing dehydrogenase
MAVEVNDVHSRLNPTRVAEVRAVASLEELRHAVREGRGTGLAIAGGRHAMGGQQFLTDGLVLDLRPLDQVLGFDEERGLLRVGAGAQWPAIIAAIRERSARWGIRQKQTGADDLTLGGSVAANVHGRGLGMGPIVEDVESLRLVDADGNVLECSRRRHPELFSLVVGGYGLFGAVHDVTLRLAPRRRLRRVVDIIDVDDAIAAAYRRFEQGCLYGDFQYAIDESDDGFLRRGVMACYKPVPDDVEVTDGTSDLGRDDWLRLLELAHRDKRAAFQRYSEHYLASHGRVYWSDTMQLSTYIPSYAEFLAEAQGRERADESLMITELYVPPDRLPAFMATARRVLPESGVEDIYGTIRSIRAEATTFLPWAREDSACVIFNLRTHHGDEGIARSRRAARALIDAAAEEGGSFFLTYHRWATREQIVRCHPRFEAFLAKKRDYDPAEVFQSDWYRHHRRLFGA